MKLRDTIIRLNGRYQALFPDRKWSGWAGMIGLFLILIGNAVFLRFNMTRGFNFLDMGAFLDAAWRVYSGQRIYQDFIYISGPVYLYLNTAFFHLFGFGPTALWVHLVSTHSAVIILVFLLIWKRLKLFSTLLITILTTASFYWGISFPWHDQTAHLWGLAGIFILFQDRLFQTRRGRVLAGFFVGILAGLAFFTKSNLGIGYALVFFIVLALSHERRDALIGFGGGVLVAAAAGLLITGAPQAYWRQRYLLASALGKDRIAELLRLENWFVNFYFLPLLIVLVNVGQFSKGFIRHLALIAGITVMGILSANTGGMEKPANISLWGIQMAAVMIYMKEIRPFVQSQYLRWIYTMSRAVLIAMILGLTALAVRNGLDLRTWSYVNWDHIGTYSLQTGPLKGWMCHPGQGKALDDLTRFIDQRVPPDETILNLSDMYIIYAQTGRPSYPGVPIMFMQGYYPVPGPQTEEVRQDIFSHPPDWIITDLGMLIQQEDFLGLHDFIKQNYSIVFRSGTYLLLRQ